jgi:hypothetical protein
LRNNLDASLNKKGFDLLLHGSLLNTEDDLNKTNFIRQNAMFSKSIKKIKLGVKEESESNLWKSSKSDSLLANSYKYFQYEAFLQNADTAKNNFMGSYRNRKDFNTKSNNLQLSSKSEDFSFACMFRFKFSQTIRTSLNYRSLEYMDTTRIADRKENNLTGRIEHTIILLRNALTINTFLESGTGLELKKEYSYLEVSPGQGVYKWIDYNKNGIKEIDEFEVATFADEANYIRIMKQGTDYIKIYANQFNEIINFKPDRMYKDVKKAPWLFRKLSNQFAYHVNRKSLNNNMLDNFNKLFQANSTDQNVSGLESSLRNTLSFNRSNPKFGVDYIYQNQKNRMLLVNGYDTRISKSSGIQLRYNIKTIPNLLKMKQNDSIPAKLDVNIVFVNNFDKGEKNFSSDFFSSKNYNILYINNESILKFQPGLNFWFNVAYKYSNNKNTLGDERSVQHSISAESSYSIASKITLESKLDYINIRFNSEQNSAIAFTMLNGLTPGNNYTWSVSLQKNISKFLQFSMTYLGRLTDSSKIVHNGSMQIRAAF